MYSTMTKTTTHTQKLTILGGLLALLTATLCCVPTFADGMKLGIGTSDVPSGGIGGGMVAINGPDNDMYDGPFMLFTTDTADPVYDDDYPLLVIEPRTHDDISIRFDCFVDPTQTGPASQRSSHSTAGLILSKYANEFAIRRATHTGGADQQVTRTKAFTINLGNGDVRFPEVFSDTVSTVNGYSPRNLSIDSTGKIGYVSSSKRYKENIQDLEPSETDWVYSLRPRRFNYKNSGEQIGEIGLIAEEVAEVVPQLVIFTPPSESEVESEPIPDAVHYEKLIVPLLAEVQRLRAEVEQLKAQSALAE